MKKNKLIGLLSLGILTISLASCEVSDITELIRDLSKTEVSNVDVVENEEDDTTDVGQDDNKEIPTTIEEKTEDEVEDIKEEPNDNQIIKDDTIEETTIMNKYQLQASYLYEYENDYEDLYGYQALALERYGSLMQDVYSTFYQQAHDFLASDEDYEVYESSNFNYIIIGEYKYKKSRYTDVIASAWITFIEENPLYYFTYTAYTIKTEGTGANTTYSFCFLGGTDYAKAEDRYEANEKVLEMINDFEEKYDSLESKDDYTVAKMIHDYICNKISYAYDEKGEASEDYWAHNILGVAMKGSGVCECYAETYLLLSYLTDLNCLIVLGTSSGGGHVWNYVEIDGIWYGVDATWDDGDEIIYDYFLVSRTIMARAHQANSSSNYGIDYQVDLPTLSSTSYDTSLDETQYNPYIPSYPTIPYPRVNPWRPGR